MNTEEVNAMTDDQLRIKAAELSGWFECADRGGDGVTGVPTKEWLDRHPDDFGSFGILHYIPEYQKNISDSWELIRALPEDMTMTIYTGRMVILEQSEMYELAGGGIAAPLYSEIARFIGDSDERNITKAFIIAMGEKK